MHINRDYFLCNINFECHIYRTKKWKEFFVILQNLQLEHFFLFVYNSIITTSKWKLKSYMSLLETT